MVRVRIFKICSWIAAGVTLLAMAFLQSLYSEYTRDMPTAPEVASGRVTRIKVFYGKTVYVTKSEEYRLYGRMGWVIGAAGACVALEYLRRRAARQLHGQPPRGEPGDGPR